MKKISMLMVSVGFMGCLCSAGVNAQILSECSYAPEQEIIRTAREYDDLKPLVGKDLNREFPCGGTILQLATLRGNSEILFYLDRDKMTRFDVEMSLKDYPIPGAPEKIPAIMFAGRYAPNQEAFQAFLNAGLDPMVKDSMGHDLKWYLARNPVMHHSDYTEYPPEVAWQKTIVNR